MASLHQLLAAVQQQVQSVTTGLHMFDMPLAVQTGLDWPPMRTIQQVAKMSPPTVLVSIYDRKYAHDSTRWGESIIAQAVTPATLTSAPAYQVLPAGGSAQVVIGGSVTSGDAVSLVLKDREFIAQYPADRSTLPVGSAANTAVVYVTNPTDSVADVATNLAALVNNTPDLGFAASAAGATVTVTSQLFIDGVLSSFTGNGGTNTVEIGRRLRHIQITCWAASPENRDTVSDPIETLIAQIEFFRGAQGQFQSGLLLPDGSFARILPVNDFLLDDAVLSDVYRRDFIISADYPVTTQDQLYSVLAPVLAYNLDY